MVVTKYSLPLRNSIEKFYGLNFYHIDISTFKMAFIKKILAFKSEGEYSYKYMYFLELLINKLQQPLRQRTVNATDFYMIFCWNYMMLKLCNKNLS